MVARALSAMWSGGSLLVPHLPPFGAAYSRENFRRDILAAATVAAITIPQAIGYALLAGLPPVHGLYAALLAGIAGALWGGSRFLSTGPIAIVSLLTLTAVSPLAAPGSPEFIALVAALALMIGLIQIGMGIARLGYLVRLVPQSVLIGFSSAAALIIATTQLPHLLGFPSQQNEFVLQIIWNAINYLPNLHPLTAVIGCCALVILMLMRKAFPTIPAALIILAAGIVASFGLDLGEQGVALAGSIPAKLPITEIPNLSPETFLMLGKKAVVLALVGFMSSYAIVKDIARRTRERVSPDEELVGQGFANLFSGLFRGYPVAGSLSRTAINYDSGAATAWSGIVVSGIIAIVILFFSPVLALLPNAVLAATLIAAVVQLVDVAHLRRIHHVSPTDGVIAGTTFVAAFILRPDDAILIGVILALALFLHRMMWADVIEIGIDPKWNVLRAIHTPDTTAERLPNTVMLRVESSFFYGNSERLVEGMRTHIMEYESEHEPARYLVIDCAGIDFIDGTGIEDFLTFLHELEEHKVTVCLMYTRRNVRRSLERAKVTERVQMVHNIAELRTVCGVIPSLPLDSVQGKRSQKQKV